MKTSTNRILTTHVGSLPRPEILVDYMIAEDKNQSVDTAAFEIALKQSVHDVVHLQKKLGIDCVSDGEFSKRGFAVYAHERLAGLEPTGRARPSPWVDSREWEAFPEFYREQGLAVKRTPTQSSMQMSCTGPVSYKGHTQLERDLSNLRAACEKNNDTEAFVPAISPSDVVGNQLNEFYDTEADFLYAVSDALNFEYRAIVDAGFTLQIDDPRLINHYVKNPGLSVAECRKWAEEQVEAINHSLSGISEEKIRYHTCYGINMGPRIHDMEMKDYLDIILKIKACAYSFEAANPRHEHEWRLWETVDLPDDKVLIPGVITHSSVLVEHAEVVADRIAKYASAVGKERVIAGGDCGFGTQASATPEVHPTIVWAKFEAMAEGSRLASSRLWD